MEKVESLFGAALTRHPRVHNWWGVRGGGTRKYAQCYVCDVEIDSWSAKWPMPKHAHSAISSHGDGHLRGWVSERESGDEREGEEING
jgi:hypothetical protein